MTVEDKTVCRIIRRDANCDAVANYNTNIEPTHFTAEACNDFDLVVQHDPVQATCASVYDFTFELCEIIFCHMG